MADKTKTSLERVIKTAIDSELKEVHTCLPAVVTKFTPSTQLIDAQITIKRKLAGELVLLPILVDVPIRYPKSATFSITFPIEVDDHVLIICGERSIDTWLTEGGIQAPFDLRKFSLSDAFALPMMYPQNDAIPDFDSDNLVIKTNDGSGFIKLKPDGVINLNGSDDTVVAFNDMKTAFDALQANFNWLLFFYNAHTHQTTVPVVTTPLPTSVVDMSPADVATVKVP